MNLHLMAAQQLHADRTEQLRSLRRPRRERRSFHVPHLPTIGWPFHRNAPCVGNAPVA